MRVFCKYQNWISTLLLILQVLQTRPLYKVFNRTLVSFTIRSYSFRNIICLEIYFTPDSFIYLFFIFIINYSLSSGYLTFKVNLNTFLKALLMRFRMVIFFDFCEICYSVNQCVLNSDRCKHDLLKPGG